MSAGLRTMRAIEIIEPGGPDVLHVASRPVPEPAAGEVLIRVAAAGVNRPDVLQRQGHYAPPPGTSDVPGLEVAGTIVGVGPDVARWHPGHAVCALLAGGGYAEYCVVPGVQCLPIPGPCDSVSAAAIPETFFTVWTNVFERGGLSRGETLLVHGGTSGIGTTAIQLGRAFDARVFATAGSDEKCAACVALGAEHAVNYRAADFVAEIQERTDGKGVDVILDMAGGDYVARNLALLAPHGRLVQIAFVRGASAVVDLRLVMHKRLTITGSTLRPRSVTEKAALAEAVERHVWPFLAAGIVAPQIFATFPLAQAAEAHRLLESGRHVGKIVLVAEEAHDGPSPQRGPSSHR